MKKLALDVLKVQSFVTLDRNETANIHGGYDEPTIAKVDIPQDTVAVGPCGPPQCVSYDCPTNLC